MRTPLAGMHHAPFSRTIRERPTDNFDVIGPEIFDDRELTTLGGRQYRVKDFVTLNRASYTPTSIFFGEVGRLLLRIVGYYPPDRFRRVLDYLDASNPFRAYQASATAASKLEAAPSLVNCGR